MRMLLFYIFVLALSGCQNLETKDYQATQHGEPLKMVDSTQVEDLSDSLVNFSYSWKADSLGRDGFRKYAYDYDKQNKSWRINKMTLKGYSKDKILYLLGPPNGSGLGREDDLLIMEYLVDYNFGKKTKTLLLYFNSLNSLNDIILETGF